MLETRRNFFSAEFFYPLTGTDRRTPVGHKSALNVSLRAVARLVVAVSCFFAGASRSAAEESKKPVRLGVVGLVHGHVRGFFTRALADSNVTIVGVVEANREVTAKYAEQHKLPSKILFTELEAMLTAMKPEAVAVFSNTFDHRRIVEMCAARGVHVMMEKPMAVNMEHARAIEKAQRRSGIHVITNYETTWYAGNHAAHKAILQDNAIGDIRKIVVHDGHQGPGGAPEFVEWLNDPARGGGALLDFACYGADLMTWLLPGQRPLSVMAVTQRLQPNRFPRVEDESTIVVTYPRAQGIIQGSWNWPYARKDMEIYGDKGSILIPERDRLLVRSGKAPEREMVATPLPTVLTGSIPYFTAVVRGEIKPDGLSSLEVNMLVTEILDAAHESARSGRRIDFAPAK